MTFNITNISRPYEMIQVVNSITNHTFGVVMGALTFIIAVIYLSSSERPFGYAFATAAFITMIITIFMRTLSIVPDWFVYTVIIATIGGVAWTVFTQER